MNRPRKHSGAGQTTTQAPPDPPHNPPHKGRTCAARCAGRDSGRSRYGRCRTQSNPTVTVKVAVDTNVLVCYLTWDAEEQAIEAAEILESRDVIVISTIVFCELVWVLKRAYRYATAEIVDVL